MKLFDKSIPFIFMLVDITRASISDNDETTNLLPESDTESYDIVYQDLENKSIECCEDFFDERDKYLFSLALKQSTSSSWIREMKRLLSELSDKEFFNICLQQDYFPSTDVELRNLFQRLDIFDKYLFEDCLSYIFNMNLYRQRELGFFENYNLFSREGYDSINHIKYFKRNVFRIIENDFENKKMTQSMSDYFKWLKYSIKMKDKKDSALLKKFFRFILILQELSICPATENKKEVLEKLKGVCVSSRKDVIDLLVDNNSVVKELKHLSVFAIPDQVIDESTFFNPEMANDEPIENQETNLSNSYFDKPVAGLNFIFNFSNVNFLRFKFCKFNFLSNEFIEKLKNFKSLTALELVQTRDLNSIQAIDPTKMKFPNLSIRKNLGLQYLYLSWLALDSVDLINLPNLKHFYIEGCTINNNINISECFPFNYFKISNSKVKEINIKIVTDSFQEVNICNTKFDSLKINCSSSLRLIKFSGSDLKSIKIERAVRTISLIECTFTDQFIADLVGINCEKLVINQCADVSLISRNIKKMKNLKSLQIINHEGSGEADYESLGRWKLPDSLEELIIDSKTIENAKSILEVCFGIKTKKDTHLEYRICGGLPIKGTKKGPKQY